MQGILTLNDNETPLIQNKDNIAIAIEESDHIFESVDGDENNLINMHEMLEGFQTFIDSDVTEFGGQLRHIRDEL